MGLVFARGVAEVDDAAVGGGEEAVDEECDKVLCGAVFEVSEVVWG